MKDTALYEQLLGLKAPWSVKKVDLSLADQRVVVKNILKKGQRHPLVGAGHLMKGLPQGAELAHQRHARGMVPGGLTAVGGMGGQVHALCGANGAVGIGVQLKAFAAHTVAVVVDAVDQMAQTERAGARAVAPMLAAKPGRTVAATAPGHQVALGAAARIAGLRKGLGIGLGSIGAGALAGRGRHHSDFALARRTCQCCLGAPAPGRSSRRIG